MAEIEFEYAGRTWETGTWMGEIKCPVKGTNCQSSTETISGMKCHLNMRHGYNEIVERECPTCGDVFEFSLTQRDRGKYCSIECANVRPGVSD